MELAMASLTIRNLDDPLKAKLRIQAAQHGRSMEEEARQILRAGLVDAGQPRRSLAASIAERFRGLGEFETPLRRDAPVREPPSFD